MAINENCTGNNCIAITGTSTGEDSKGIIGKANGQRTYGVVGYGEAVGVQGEGTTWHGVVGLSKSTIGGFGVYGANTAGGSGVVGESKGWHAVGGFSQSTTGGAGVYGKGKGTGVIGEGETYGIVGIIPGTQGTISDAAILGESKGDYGYGIKGKSNNVAISAESTKSTALIATTRGRDVSALIVNQWGTGNIIIGRDNRNAEVFRVLNNGDVQVRGITITSDKNEKENFLDVNVLEILDKLTNMPIQSWNYKADSNNIRHIGPTAQDFKTAFGLNGDDHIHISSIDLQGVSLAAIQGLNKKNEELKIENAQLHMRLANLEARLSKLESKS
ncbi:tail fiber domain-containing protein [Bacillus cereus]|uniref:tail fiber domain-containing protein n=1 Tax=Bacillus cereus TaxID=1396 RepID=UPI000777C0A9|nr:tail fiber domain-containing protein [Bacillus cereus]UUE91496.1 tail fiber domain-containing protein [Bacillus cereus]